MLIAWELGAGLGHLMQILPLAEDLACEGYRVFIALREDHERFTATVRIDTPGEADYYRHGGIMQYVLRSLR